MTHNHTPIDIPVDVYDSPQEFVIVMPLGGVQKDSVSLSLDNTTLKIMWKRVSPQMKDTLVPKKLWCFWWEFSKIVPLPTNSYFNNIHSNLSSENILTVIVPKVIVPEEIIVNIE